MSPILLSALLLATSASATQIEIAADRDNTLIQSPEDYSNGLGPVVVGVTSYVGIRRGLVHFDVAAAIPAGATIDAVELRMEQVNAAGSLVSADLGLHPAGLEWGEGASDGSGGAGAPAETGDATWLCGIYTMAAVGCTTVWTTPGGDFDPIADGTMSITAALGPTSAPSTSGMVSRVQGWLDTPSGNLGWVLVSTDEVTQQTVAHFDSHEDGATGPRLVVDYTEAVATTGTGTGTGATTGAATGTGTGTGTATGTGTGTGAATGTGTGTGTGSADTDDSGLSDDKGGCGCATQGAPTGWIGLGLLGLLVRRRVGTKG